MNKIFGFLDYNSLYRRCIVASIAHAIMVGKYDLLSAEQSWQGSNYTFQNMEGVRGVISFSENYYVCVVQNSVSYNRYAANKISELFHGAEKNIIELAEDEALQYMLVNYNGNNIPFISAVFWGINDNNFSNQSEKEIIKLSEKIILPFLYSEEDAKKYWGNYYEMNEAQYKMMEDIYDRRIILDGRINLTRDEKNRLLEWFDNIEECIESFKELNIFMV